MSARVLIAALVLLGVAATARAQSVIYRWVDEQGVVHFTDDLSKVPEPYASMYQARIRELEKKRAEKVGDRKEPPPDSSPPRRAQKPPQSRGLADQIEADRKRWQDRVAKWRKELADATDALAKLDEMKGQLTVNPLLRVTPQVKAQIEDVEERRKASLERVERAKKMLLETIPEEAKKAGVPYKWLL